MTLIEARKHYGIIQTMIRSERDKRDKFLHGVRREAALREADVALSSLEALGRIIKQAHEAGILTSGVEQATLLDVGEPPVSYP